MATSATSTTTMEPRPSHEYGGPAVVGEDQEPPTLNTFVPGGDSSVAARIGQGYLAGVITGQELPYLDEVIFRFIPRTDGPINAFKVRELDVIQPPPDTESIQQLQALEPAGARVEVLSGPLWEHLSFQFGQGRLERNPDSCSENLNLRTAVAHAIDRTKLTDELLAGQVEPMSSYVEALSPTLSNGNWAKYEADVGKAADAYLAAATETGKECKVVLRRSE